MNNLNSFRKDIRSWLAENCPHAMRTPMLEKDVCRGGRSPVFQSEEQQIWLKRMSEKGWTAPTWPVEYGGAGFSKDQAKILREELSLINARPPISGMGISMIGPAILEFGSEKLKDLDTGEELNVSKRIIISGDNLIDAKPQMDNINNETVVSFTLDRLGARKFGRATKNGIGKQLAIVLDNQIISAPVIRDVIASGSGQISGGFTFQSATDLALLLRSGALPAPLDIIEERTVGPDLGEDSIKAGVLSLIIGFILVILYMIYKYRLFGLISNFALIINLFMLLGFLTIFEATLTLPGIAGIILTVGMAVDANVLIFERIKEELKKEKNKVIAFDNGYTLSRTAILDANITTIIAALILFVFGSGPVKGFSVTLSIGILTTLFSVYYIARLLTSLYVIKNKNNEVTIK